MHSKTVRMMHSVISDDFLDLNNLKRVQPVPRKYNVKYATGSVSGPIECIYS